MRILHLTASPFYGGPERVIMDLVRTQSSPEFGVESVVVSFRENGGCETFLSELERAGFDGRVLPHDMPRLVAATNDLIRLLKSEKIDLLCAHGHKSRLLGWIAARRVGIPVVGVSHGWTWQDWKTSFYERIDQWVHRRMDRVICVSQGQAEKVVKAGTPKSRVVVIHNAIDPERFQGPFDPVYRKRLEDYFDFRPELIVGAAGRLSPEKGFGVLVDAVEILSRSDSNEMPSFAVVLFGDGFLRERLQARIDGKESVRKIFRLAGFTSELDKFLPHFDLFVQSSHTEGFPCVNLEAMASRVPVVATAVGGVPEQIEDGRNGSLVPPSDPGALAEAIRKFLEDADLRKKTGETGREIVLAEFTCEKQARRYFDVFYELIATGKSATTGRGSQSVAVRKDRKFFS